ncbi:serine-threonine protein kinase, putative [Entamoeba invadens IP1]|uniref:serine-threonine protein kinase, putative n=1 Tax=Entamoeba invadens IP1 TaxID=370355 RepID=UPI0002C3DFCF|nr:serine-threonine protein kinase, putative [Entamoeba invadens IP1]ELP90663.1 serine-threonine protein kinase, putative [Entamoeba invadens IP1]|eukprot:XP_004257434.1 serine-threonine protein kinase, putative [Entamoeba invadens IP1]
MIYIPFFLFLAVNSFECSVGCLTPCVSDFTCLTCKEGYYQDSNCEMCQNINPNIPISEENPLYVKVNSTCQKTLNVYNKTTWMPSEYIALAYEQTVKIKFDSETKYDVGPCVFAGNKQNQYRPARWLSVNITGVTQLITLSFKFVSPKKQSVFYDITSSAPNESIPNCLVRGYLPDTLTDNSLTFPKPKSTPTVTTFYLFLSLSSQGENVEVAVSLSQSLHVASAPYYAITKYQVDKMVQQKRIYTVDFPMYSRGNYLYPVCAPGKLMKALIFTMDFSGDYSVLVNSSIANRYEYLEEYSVDAADKVSCDAFWGRSSYGVWDGSSDVGLLVRVKGDVNRLRNFTILTTEHDTDISLIFKVICPNDCNSKSGHGQCSTKRGECICEDKYGGEACDLKCYYNNSWQPIGNKGDNQCFYGSDGCLDNCTCKSRYQLEDHFCVSEMCYSNLLNASEDNVDENCLKSTPHCLINCKCEVGYKATEEYRCLSEKCGNGILDEGESCDSGTNCNKYCECAEGFSQDASSPNNCIKKGFEWYFGMIIGIVALVIIVIILISIVSLVIITQKRKKNYDIYKEQQSVYYLYLTGSVNDDKNTKKEREEESRVIVEPLELEFGNEGVPTEVFDTRFEEIEIKNKSGNKWMMVIIHTPNNPKYVFHFEPQVAYLRPKATMTTTSYMTLRCTTKIKDMKIPYSVWFSRSKKTLEKIENILKGKSFEEWSTEDQRSLDVLLKEVVKRSHNFFTIKTDAASSTHLDMDELGIRDKVISETEKSKILLGKYRSIPVAVKLFKFDNLSEEVEKQRRKEITDECELMTKLRNPFVVGYLGSVTYLPQIAMVMQYFVLGSLKDYLNTPNSVSGSKNVITMPYKLKIKILIDCARGMQFLHENKIVHSDLKPDNLLINSLYFESPCVCKITDFGSNSFVRDFKDKRDRVTRYMAPECFSNYFSYGSDKYAFGIIGWELFYMKNAFFDYSNEEEIKSAVLNGKRPEFDDTISVNLKAVFETAWKQKEEDRPSFDSSAQKLLKILEEAANHPELDNTSYMEIIEEFINEKTRKLDELLVDE